MSDVTEREARLLAEIDRLRARCRQIDDEAYDYAEQIEQLKAAAKDSADHYADARAENAALTAAVERVRALHRNRMHGAHDCAECHDGYPCPTLRALEVGRE